MSRTTHVCVFLVSLTLMVLGGVGGVCASRGMCDYIFGPAVTDDVLRRHEFGHPAWWLFLFTALVGVLIGFFGTLFTVVVPLAACGKLPGTFDDRASRRFLVAYAVVLRRLNRIERTAGQHADRVG